MDIVQTSFASAAALINIVHWHGGAGEKTALYPQPGPNRRLLYSLRLHLTFQNERPCVCGGADTHRGPDSTKNVHLVLFVRSKSLNLV